MENQLAKINQFNAQTLVSHLGIEVTSWDTQKICGTMPVDERTKQPMGLLHGGASVVLAETLGSIGSTLLVRESGKVAVGLSITANHLKSAKSGKVFGEASLIHMGQSTHVWDIQILNEEKQKVCICRLTMAIIEPK